MSLPAENIPEEDLVEIEINGQTVKAQKGAMIIQAADDNKIAIPRFCYHKKLTIHANCRVCMVEVEQGGRPAPKPMPACATPVADGMKVWTKSEQAMSAQRNGLEFLLINHPLDCPVCDQGGECELQDLALGFGRSVSRFTERKRVVADEDIGPLIATEMTRCIHCMRCVRFLREVAGTNELGGMDRGDRMKIGTYIGRSVDSEIGGNIIDLCPVGALTNKPFQFKARAWELVARPSISYHDALGSNLWLHTRRGEVLRIVPRDNEAINECWLADRDRYAHEGMYAEDRVHQPRVKVDGQWQDASWDDVLVQAAQVLRQAEADDVGVLVHPATSNEEGMLIKRLADKLQIKHVDHRLDQLDFADKHASRAFALPVEDFDKLDAALVLGSDTRSEIPLLHNRLRQASTGIIKHAGAANRARFDITHVDGAHIHVLNPADFAINFELASHTIVPVDQLVDAALELVKAAQAQAESHVELDADLAAALETVTVGDTAKQTIADLAAGDKSVVLLGAIAHAHPYASWLRAAGEYIAAATGASVAHMPLGANAIGLTTENVLPADGGFDARTMLQQQRKHYVLYGIEPAYDFADNALAQDALSKAENVIAFAAFAPQSLLDVADVIIPLSLFPENDATMINVEGTVQQMGAGSRAPGDVRQGWKVLRALGGELALDGFTFTSLDEVRADLQSEARVPAADGRLAHRTTSAATTDAELVRLATRPIYRSDAVVRRAPALNAHALNRAPAARLNPQDMTRLGVTADALLSVAGTELPCVADDGVPAGCVWIENSSVQTSLLPPCGAHISVNKA